MRFEVLGTHHTFLGADEADAEATTRERDPPSPSLLQHEDEDVSRLPELGVRRFGEVVEVCVDRRVAEIADALVGLLLAGQDAVSTRGVDDEASALRAGLRAGRIHLHAVLENPDVGDSGLFADLGAERARALEQPQVEHRAFHLPRMERRPRQALAEGEAPELGGALVDEVGPRFVDRGETLRREAEAVEDGQVDGEE